VQAWRRAPAQNVAPYGAWESPLTASMLAGANVRLSGIVLDGADACWVEGRPLEGGRSVLVRRAADGTVAELTPAPWNVRSRVHEYGGGAATVRGGTSWFVHDADQQLYRLDAGGAPRALTRGEGLRHADPSPSPDGRLVACVCEDHSRGGEPENRLVVMDAGGDTRVLHRGHDFYASPRFSPDGRELAFIAWDHPRMPWDGTVLYRALVDADGGLTAPLVVAGGPSESVFQPQWAPDGRLWFVSDREGFWNLHVLDAHGEQRCVIREEAEYGLPQWQFSMSTYGFSDPGTLVAASCVQGRWRVQAVDLASLTREPLPVPISAVSALVAGAGQALLIAASEDHPESVLRWNPAMGTVEVLRASAEDTLEPAFFSRPETLAFPTAGGVSCHAFFYPPVNPGFAAPGDERPPLIVIGHGGPTGATTAALSPATQYWTTRGFAVLDVNYRGSTGYGRAYRELLDGAWGVADVEDCVHGARHLAAIGRVDPARMAIRGRSAGGYTVLAALAFHDTFAAGASHYGIGELEALARDTHKFESRYLDRLVGPWPHAAALYRERSPVHHVDGLSCPVIFFQGLEDRVVPPDQARTMADALRAKGIPVACLMFEGEQHGFRKAETIVRALEAELYFYGRVFGFRPADAIEPVAIDNL
jgi:dipeptidyl aminopeptidase/acylaminoacyl peptidase